jgi:hypothetical protein
MSPDKVLENSITFAVYDAWPVNEGHLLIILYKNLILKRSHNLSFTYAILQKLFWLIVKLELIVPGLPRLFIYSRCDISRQPRPLPSFHFGMGIFRGFTARPQQWKALSRS